MDSNVPIDFINKCKESSQKIVNERDVLYSREFFYCTRDALISDLIKEKNLDRTVLSEGDSNEYWRAARKIYRRDNLSGPDRWNLNNWDSIKGQDDAQEAFAKACMDKSQVLKSIN